MRPPDAGETTKLAGRRLTRASRRCNSKKRLQKESIDLGVNPFPRRVPRPARECEPRRRVRPSDIRDNGGIVEMKAFFGETWFALPLCETDFQMSLFQLLACYNGDEKSFPFV